MNDNEAILAELKKVSAWVDMQRKATKWSLIAVAVLLPVSLVFAYITERNIKKSLADSRAPSEALDWYDVERQVRQCDPNKAIEIGESLIAKTPLYPDGHRRLAAAYLAAGRIEKATEHHREAFRLFPSKDNEEALAAVSRRMKQESPQPGVEK